MSQTVDELLDQVATAVMGDPEALRAVVDEDVLLLGTDPGEEIEGGQAAVAAMARQVETAGRATFESEDDRRVRTLGDVAWFAEHGRMHFGEQGLRVRLSGVAVRSAGDWRIVQLQAAPCEEPASLRPIGAPDAARS